MSAIPRHVAIIMDGNGRAAKRKGQDRSDGHTLGVEAVRRTLEHAIARGVSVLTLFAFSEQNWLRDDTEVQHILGLLARFAAEERASLLENGVRFRVLGRLEMFPELIQVALRQLEDDTKDGKTLTLVLALSYGGVEEVREALERARASTPSHGAIELSDWLPSLQEGPVDLLIRTGGEKRVSNFVLLAIAYAELYFSNVMWPDFGARAFDRAIASYAKRERRFGKVGKAA